MATYEAAKVRAVALEMHEKALDLYAALLPVITITRNWTLNGLDSMLPQPFDVKVQLDAYKALAVQRLKLDDWVTAIQLAQPADTLTYPPPQIVGGSGMLAFDEISFEHINF